MANLQVKNVPDAVYRKIRRHAAREGQTLREFVLDAVRAKLARQEFHERLARRTPVVLQRPASELVEETRRERDGELAR
jgi:plasmid stability protein